MKSTKKMAGKTGLEPATSTVTGWHSNQLSYFPAVKRYSQFTPEIVFFKSGKKKNQNFSFRLLFFRIKTLISSGWCYITSLKLF